MLCSSELSRRTHGHSTPIAMEEIENGSEGLFSESAGEADNDCYSSESDEFETVPALTNSAPLLSKKKPRPFYFSKRRVDVTKSRNDFVYHREWLKRRGSPTGAANRGADDVRTPSGRPRAQESEGSSATTEPLYDAPDSSPAALVSSLSELNNTMTKLVQRIKNQELRLKSMEEKLDSTSNSLSSSASDSKVKLSRKVPVIVRVSHSN